MLRTLTLKQKLIGGLGVVMPSMAIGAVFSIIEIRGLTQIVSEASGIHDLTEIGTLAADMIGLERAIVLHSISDDKTNVELFKTRLDVASRGFMGSLDSVSSSLTSRSVKTTIPALRNRYADWMSMHKEIVTCLD